MSVNIMPSPRVSLREWKHEQPSTVDKVSVGDLRLIANAGFDAWGRRKPQPVNISVVLSLKKPISSAATNDKIDSSTVHYGDLSKRIVSVVENVSERWTSPDALARDLVFQLVPTTFVARSFYAVEVALDFQKASLLGDGINLTTSYAPESQVFSEVLQIRNLRVPSIIGVNAHERHMKQMVVVSVWFDRIMPNLVIESFKAEQITTKVSLS